MDFNCSDIYNLSSLYTVWIYCIIWKIVRMGEVEAIWKWRNSPFYDKIVTLNETKGPRLGRYVGNIVNLVINVSLH